MASAKPHLAHVCRPPGRARAAPVRPSIDVVTVPIPHRLLELAVLLLPAPANFHPEGGERRVLRRVDRDEAARRHLGTVI